MLKLEIAPKMFIFTLHIVNEQLDPNTLVAVGKVENMNNKYFWIYPSFVIVNNLISIVHLK